MGRTSSRSDPRAYGRTCGGSCSKPSLFNPFFRFLIAVIKAGFLIRPETDERYASSRSMEIGDPFDNFNRFEKRSVDSKEVIPRITARTAREVFLLSSGKEDARISFGRVEIERMASRGEAANSAAILSG
jgi:hypothetical protein